MSAHPLVMLSMFKKLKLFREINGSMRMGVAKLMHIVLEFC